MSGIETSKSGVSSSSGASSSSSEDSDGSRSSSEGVEEWKCASESSWVTTDYNSSKESSSGKNFRRVPDKYPWKCFSQAGKPFLVGLLVVLLLLVLGGVGVAAAISYQEQLPAWWPANWLYRLVKPNKAPGGDHRSDDGGAAGTSGGTGTGGGGTGGGGTTGTPDDDVTAGSGALTTTTDTEQSRSSGGAAKRRGHGDAEGGADESTSASGKGGKNKNRTKAKSKSPSWKNVFSPSGAGAGADEEEDDETDSSGLSSDSEEQPPGGQTRDRVGDGIKRKGAGGEGEENANANGSPPAPARVADSTVARDVQIDAAVEQLPSSPRRTTVVNLNTAVLGTPTGRTGLAPGVDSATATPTSVGATTAFLEDFSPEEVAALESEVTELDRKIHDLRRHREISRHTLQGGKGLFYAAPSPGRPFGSLHFRVPAERQQLVPDESVDECVEQREAWIRKQRRNDEFLEPLRKKYPPNWVCKKRSPTSSSSSSTWREELEDDAAKLPRPSRLKRRIERKTELLQKLEKAKERNWDRATPRGFGFWWNRADGDAARKETAAVEDGVGTAPEAPGTEPDAPGASAQSEDDAARSRVTSDAPPGPVGPGIRTDETRQAALTF